MPKRHCSLPKSAIASFSLLIFLMASFLPLAHADDTYYQKVYSAKTHKYVYVPAHAKATKTSVTHSPVFKGAAVGGISGLGLGLLTGHSLLRGGVAGVATGAGVGLVDQSQTFKNKPLARRALNGTIIGTGVGIAVGTALLPAAVIGAGIGTGVHFAKQYIDKP